MNQLSFFILFLISSFVLGQKITGEIFLKDIEKIYINNVYITNLNTQETKLAGFQGKFSISAQAGDILRFTSNRTIRKDVLITPNLEKKGNFFVEIEIRPKDIPEVIITRFKPSGDLRKDSEKLTKVDQSKAIKKAVGLPEPKDSANTATSPASFANGGFNINLNSIYDIFSGEVKKRKRRLRYEKMQNTIKIVRKSIGDEYFTTLKIPKNMIGNFLEFIYYSENKNLTAQNVTVLAEKYLPIFQQRLKNSKLL